MTDALTFEQIATYPLPGTAAPSGLSFSPDDALLTYLFSAEGSLHQELWGYDLASGERRRVVSPPGAGDTEENLSLEEKLRRERLRLRALGITRYAWAKQGQRLIVPISGGSGWCQGKSQNRFTKV